MKKRVPDKFWFPWWPDKWIFGSVRIEFTPAERGMWVDMLSLASKDNGHIRANEETPYPLAQLAGMLIIPEKELDAAINKFIKHKKLIKLKSGTFYVTKWEKYQFSERHKRRVEDKMSDETDTMSKKGTPIINNSTLNNSTLNNKDNIHSTIKHWNSQKMKNLEERETNIRKKTLSKIQKQLKDYSLKEINEAITNYAIILKDDKYFFSYSWQLWEFLDRGLVNFLTKNEPFKNYLSDKDKGSTREEQRKKKLDDWVNKPLEE